MECFAVYSNNLEGRLDCFYYKPDNRIIINSKYPIKNIEDITLKIIHPPEYKRIYSNKGYQLLRAQNVKPYKINIDSNKVFFSKESLPSKNLIFPEIGDVLVVRSGVNTGDCAVIEERYDDLILGSDNLVCKCKNEIRPKYLMIYLCSDLGKKLLAKYITGATNYHITPQNLGKIKIPIPFIENQDNLVQLMDQAYSLKESKEAEAHRLLDSINDYVLEELEIKLPELKDKMAYVVESEEVQNKRADAYYYQPKFEEVEKAIKKGKFEVKELKEIIDFIPGYAFNSNDYVYNEGIKLLTIRNIKENFIDLSDTTLLPNDFFERYDKFQIKNGDIVIAMTGATIGKSFIFNFDDKVLLNQRVGIIRAKEKLNKYFLLSFIKSPLFKQKILRQSCGGAQPNISEYEITSIKIPLPLLSIQNKIAEEVKKRMQKADQLQKEAKEELEKAKKEVEEIILGEK
jgi:type I restriction enzyme M protein